MKKQVTAILFTAIMIVLCTTVFGQQRKLQTVTDEKCKIESYNGPAIKESYAFYYNNDDKRVIHGPYTQMAEEKTYRGFHKGVAVYDKISYSSTLTYKDGKLDGPVSIKYYVQVINNYNHDKTNYELLEVSANFSDGKPCGTWKWLEDKGDFATTSQKPQIKGIQKEISFTNGIITKFTYGTDVISLNGYGVTSFDVEVDGMKVKDGYALEYYRKNGDRTPLEAEQLQLIDGLKKLDISEDDLPLKGYITEQKEVTYKLAKEYEIEIYGCGQWGHDKYDITRGIFSKLSNISAKYIMLRRIPLNEATLDQCLQYCRYYRERDKDERIQEKIDKYNSIMEKSYYYDDWQYYNGEYWYRNSVAYFVVSENVKAELTEAMSPLFLPKYNIAVNLMNGYKKNNSEALTAYSKAAEIFEENPRFKDSKEKGEYCRNKIVEIANDVIKDTKAKLDQYQDSTGINAWFVSKNAKEDLESLSWMGDEEVDFLLSRCYEMSEKTFKSAYDEIAEKIDYLSQTQMTVYAEQSILDEFTLFIAFLQEAGKDEKSLVKYLNIPQGQYLNCNNGICLDDKSLGYLNKSKAYREKIEKGMARIEYVEKKLNQTLHETMEISKRFKLEKIDFYSSSPANYYNNFDFYGCPINNQYKTYTEARVLDTALSMFCPMVGYRILEVAKDIISGFFLADCEIDKKLPGKIGDYETYRTCFVLTDNGEISVQNINYSKKYTEKIRNDWDKLKDNDSKILTKSKECKNIVSAYSKYMKTADKTTEERLGKIISNQEKILKAINSSNAVELDNKVKALKDKSIENVIKTIQ